MSLRDAIVLLGAALLLAAASWLTARALRASDRRARVRRAARAQRAERGARRVLEGSGFVVVAEQARQAWSVTADGEAVSFNLIADFIVERRGRRWVAEVKTGSRALDLRFGPTRRQLLEYREAFGVQGVLLVDSEGGAVREIHFPERGSSARSGHNLSWLIGGVALGAALMAWLR